MELELTGLLKTSNNNLVEKIIGIGDMFSQIKGRNLTLEEVTGLFGKEAYSGLTDEDKDKILEYFNLK